MSRFTPASAAEMAARGLDSAGNPLPKPEPVKTASTATTKKKE
jgi:hypothetical protein